MQETEETWVWSLGWKIPWRRVWQPTPVFLPGESHGERSLQAIVHRVTKYWTQLKLKKKKKWKWSFQQFKGLLSLKKCAHYPTSILVLTVIQLLRYMVSLLWICERYTLIKWSHTQNAKNCSVIELRLRGEPCFKSLWSRFMSMYGKNYYKKKKL